MANIQHKNLFWNDILLKSETQWRQWSTHLHQDFKLLLQKVFAPWPVVKMHTARLILLNRPHHHHYYIISYLHNKHHHYHHYDKVESGNTIYICSCPHTVQWHQLHHHISNYSPPLAEFLRWKATMLHAVAPKGTLAIQKFVANLRPSGTMSMSNWIGLNIVILKSECWDYASPSDIFLFIDWTDLVHWVNWVTGQLNVPFVIILVIVIFIVILVIIGIIVIIVTVDISLVLLFIGSLGHWFIGCATWLWTCGCVFNSMLPALDFPYCSYHHCLKMMQQLFFLKCSTLYDEKPFSSVLWRIWFQGWWS